MYMQRRVEAAITLQAAVRGWVRRRDVERQHSAAILIQVRLRQWLVCLDSAQLDYLIQGSY